jgi:hypothetical protein
MKLTLTNRYGNKVLEVTIRLISALEVKQEHSTCR